MTLKPNGFKALSVKHPKDLLKQVKKVMKLNLTILSIKANFHLLTQILKSLIRQEVRLLSEKLKVINIIPSFFFLLFIYLCQGYSSNKLPRCIQNIHNKRN
jgi:hypothetical protein